MGTNKYDDFYSSKSMKFNKAVTKSSLVIVIISLLPTIIFAQSNCQTPSYDAIYQSVYANDFEKVSSYFKELGGIKIRDTIEYLPCNDPECTLTYREFEYCSNSSNRWKVFLKCTKNLNMDIWISTTNSALFYSLFNSIKKYIEKETKSYGTKFYITSDPNATWDKLSGLEANFESWESDDGASHFRIEFHYWGK